MTIFDTVLFSMLATFFTLKVALLAAAAVLLANGLAEQIRRRKATVAVKQSTLKLHT